jgi:hypothetical protein
VRSVLWVFSGCGAIRAGLVRAVVALVGGLLLLAPASAWGATTIDATAGQPFSGAVADVSCTIVAATIDWGDGTASSVGTEQSNGEVDGTHTYESPGAYYGTVTYQCPGADKATVDFTADVMTATTVTLASSAHPSAPGAQVTFTATVSPVPDGGYIEFTDNGLPAGAGGSEISDCVPTVVSAGVAICTTSSLTTPGPYSIVATYSGDASYAGAFSPTLTQTVSKNQTTTTVIDSDLLASVVDSSDSFAATVTPVPDGGTVAFSDNGVTIPGCAAIAVSTTSGVAGGCDDHFAFSSQGNHTIVATYSGDANYAASSHMVTVAVGPFATTTTLTASTDPVAVGASVTFTATVSPTPNNPGFLLGDLVQFTDNGFTLDNGGSPISCTNPTAIGGLLPLAGGSVATCTATFSTKGYYSIVAQYGGDSTYDGSTSPLLFLSVGEPLSGFVVGRFFVNPRDWLTLEDETSGPGVLKGTAIANLVGSTRELAARTADSGHVHDRNSRTRQIVYGRGRVTVARAGSVALTIKPRGAGLAALKKHHRLRLAVTVKFTPTGAKRAITRMEHVIVTYKHSTKASTTG